MRVAVSERRDGSMGFSRAPDPAAVQAARRAFLAAGGMDPAAAVSVRQVHGARVLVAGPGDRGKGVLGEADGIATSERGLPLLALSADCAAGAIADRAGRAVGAFHAGWRGVLAGAPAAAAAAVARLAGVPAADLRAVLGPAIGPCCCEVGEEVRESFRERFGPRVDAWFRPGKRARPHLDLPGAVRATLADSGIPEAAVAPSVACTLCGGDWFSHRRGDAGRVCLAVFRA